MSRRAWIVALGLAVTATSALTAQRGAGPAPQTPSSARDAAPIDLTGTWVSVVTEDWRWRMMTPAKGDYMGVPLTPQGRKAADNWDLARDNAEGNQCRPFGVGNIMRVPGRVKIAWEDANTLRMDFDAGTQTRLLRFGSSPQGVASWQGRSTATWEFTSGGRGAPAGASRTGDLKVTTTGMRAGYLRKNGVPYSDKMVLTEYFDRHSEQGDEWFTVMAIAEDPTNLSEPFVVTTSFKKEPDSSKWKPTPCETSAPTR
jgi:hypothetical protein